MSTWKCFQVREFSRCHIYVREREREKSERENEGDTCVFHMRFSVARARRDLAFALALTHSYSRLLLLSLSFGLALAIDHVLVPLTSLCATLTLKNVLQDVLQNVCATLTVERSDVRECFPGCAQCRFLRRIRLLVCHPRPPRRQVGEKFSMGQLLCLNLTCLFVVGYWMCRKRRHCLDSESVVSTLKRFTICTSQCNTLQLTLKRLAMFVVGGKI